MNIWLQCFMEPECQIVILCKEISMIFPLEIKSLFRPPLLVAFLMSNKIAGAVQEEEDAVCLQVHPSPILKVVACPG